MPVSCEFCVLSGRGVRDGKIIRPEESSTMGRSIPTTAVEP